MFINDYLLQDVAGVGLKHGTSPQSTSSSSSSSSSLESTLIDQASSRLHPASRGSDAAVPRLHHVLSTVTSASSCMNGVPSSSDISLEGSGKMESEPHFHGLTSPIIADLPLISMRSPPLSLEFTASEVRKLLQLIGKYFSRYHSINKPVVLCAYVCKR